MNSDDSCELQTPNLHSNEIAKLHHLGLCEMLVKRSVILVPNTQIIIKEVFRIPKGNM